MPIYKPRKEVSEEINPADTLISNFQLQNCEKINFCWLSYPVCGTSLWQPKQTNTPNFLEKQHTSLRSNQLVIPPRRGKGMFQNLEMQSRWHVRRWLYP